jgi:membrane protease YdiL (CAAX protease family)
MSEEPEPFPELPAENHPVPSAENIPEPQPDLRAELPLESHAESPPEAPEPQAEPPLPASGFEGSWETAGRSTASAATFGLLAVGVIYSNGLGFLVIFTAAFSAATRGSGDSDAFPYPSRFAIMFAQFAFMLAPTIWLVHKWHTHRFLDYIRFKETRPINVLTAVVCTAVFFPLNLAIGAFFLHFLHVPDFLLKLNSGFLTAHSPGEFVWLIVVIAVTPAICEETLFRGFAQRTYERSMGWKSILLTGLIFGLYHMQPLGLFTLSILGFMFGYFYYKSGSMLPSMAAHFTNNFLAVLADYRGVPEFSKSVTNLILISSVLILICILTLYQKSSHSRTPALVEDPPAL